MQIAEKLRADEDLSLVQVHMLGTVNAAGSRAFVLVNAENALVLTGFADMSGNTSVFTPDEIDVSP